MGDAALAHAARTRADGQILTFDAEFRKLPAVHVQDL
jgi:predicted nucleic acid-binding protein